MILRHTKFKPWRIREAHAKVWLFNLHGYNRERLKEFTEKRFAVRVEFENTHGFVLNNFMHIYGGRREVKKAELWVGGYMYGILSH